MVLTSPEGIASSITVSRIGVTAAGAFGDDSNYGGSYTFTDEAGTTNIWTAAAGVGPDAVVPPSAYRPTAGGGPGQTNPAPFTSLTSAFAGLTTAQINGIWTLSIRDGGGGDTGTVTAAQLTLGGTCAPTVVTVGGRVLTPSGLSLRNAAVALTDSQGIRRTATTTSFGTYMFDSVRTGETYILGVSSKRYRFAPLILLVNDNLSNVNFVGLE